MSSGRVQLLGIVLPNDIVVLVANVYCWTNGHTVTTAASRTDDLFHIIFEEFSHQPPGHRIIAGDLNADTADIPTLQSALDNNQFVDLGASI
eukprot:4508159-Karenia_brevis.AAC.1